MSKRPGDPGYAAGWCIHYRAPRFGPGGSKGHDTCEAGVSFDSWDGTKFADRLCFLTEAGESKPGALPCAHLRRPTPEEIAAHEAWFNDRMERTGIAMQAVFPFRKTHRGKRHMIDCPVCKTGQLHFSIAASNGHCHARCTTVDCVQWVE